MKLLEVCVWCTTCSKALLLYIRRGLKINEETSYSSRSIYPFMAAAHVDIIQFILFLYRNK